MAIPVRKTLFVGLGGFGKATLRTLRRKLYENFGFWQIPAFEYLILDTDNDPGALMYKSAYDSIDRQVAFSRVKQGGEGEFVDLSCQREALEKLYRGQITQDVKDALKWFDGRLQSLGLQVLEDGAGGIRSFGKLAFLLALLHGNRNMQEAVQRKLLHLHNLSAKDHVWHEVNGKFTLDPNYDRIDIFFFCSTAGGTGAGTFLDLSYFTQDLFQNKGIDISGTAERGDIILYLYLPDIILEDSRAQQTFRPPEFLKVRGITPQKLVKAGSYAALSELERYQLSLEQDFRFDGGWRGTEYFVPDWKPYKDPNKKLPNDEFIGKRAFNWVYLVGNRSTTGHPLRGAEDAIEMTADKIFLLIVERDRGILLRALLAGRPIFTLPEMLKPSGASQQKAYSRYYSGFGLAKIFVGETLIKRWAAFYLAERFINALLNSQPMSNSEIVNEINAIWKSYEWNTEDVFATFADEMLTQVRSLFHGLKNFDEFFELSSSGVNFKSEIACYGKISEVDIAYGEWKKAFESKEKQEKYHKMMEEWFIKQGLRPTLQLLDAMIDRINRENAIVKKNMAKSVVNPEDFSDECREWIFSVRNKLDWLGKNNPDTPRAVSVIFKETLTILDHLDELSKIPPYAAEKVRPFLQDHFRAFFLDNRCCQGWPNQLVKDSQIPETQGRIQDIRRGLVCMFKEVLKRVDYSQNNLLNLLIQTRNIISGERSSAAQGTLERTLMDIISRDDKGHITGLRPELEDLSRKSNDRSRDIYCGALFQKKENLRHPDPDPIFMADTLREGFGTRASDGTSQSLHLMWDLSRVPSLDDGIRQWINVLIDRGATELNITPTLQMYYDQLKNQRATQLKDDLSHCLKTSASYLRFHAQAFGDAQQTQIQQLVFAPTEIKDEISKIVGASVNVSAYNGKELVSLTIEDGVPVPCIDIMDDLHRGYQDFDWPRAVWTREGTLKGLLSTDQDHDVEIEIYLGLLLANIWFDRVSKRYKMVLERQGMPGAPQQVPIGASINEVKSFFYGPRSRQFIEPYVRVRDLNYQALQSRFVLSKLMSLMLYFEKYYFSGQMEGPSGHDTSHYYVVEEIKKRRSNMVAQLFPDQNQVTAINQESMMLSSWLHAFCEIVPILDTADFSKPDRDWLPVLMRNWSPDSCRNTLLWHNSNFSPENVSTARIQGAQLYRYAMDANPGQEPEGRSLNGWDERDPTNIPDKIFELAWGIQGPTASTKDPSSVWDEEHRGPAEHEEDEKPSTKDNLGWT